MAARPGGESEVAFGPMLEADLDQVLAIERVAFKSPWSRQSFLFDMTENPFARSIVARDGTGAVAGYGCSWHVQEELRINNIAVRVDMRRLNVGRSLLRQMLAEGRRAGCRIALLEVRPSNIAARALYESEGFVQIGRRKDYYLAEREDALVMALELGREN